MLHKITHQIAIQSAVACTYILPVISFDNMSALKYSTVTVFFSLPDEPVVHQWIYPGQCPHSLGEWAWMPFRNHCYAFNLQNLKLQQDARMSCKKGREAFQKCPPTSTILTLLRLLMCCSYSS